MRGKVVDLTSCGEGVIRVDEKPFFLEGVLPGEEVEFRLREERSRYGRGEVVQLERLSPERVAPSCPFFHRCGGCQLMHMSYPAQLSYKQKKVAEALHRIGGFTECHISPCKGAPQKEGYRTKIELQLRLSPLGPELGFMGRSGHSFVPIDACQTHVARGEEVLALLRQVLHEEWKRGNQEIATIRHIIIRSGFRSQDLLLLLVSPSRKLREVGERIGAQISQVSGVVRKWGPHFFSLFGRPFLYEEISGKRIRISASSFAQNDLAQAESIYEEVLRTAALTAADRILDAYCGMGITSLLFAERAREVVGVEVVSHAIADAKWNAANNAATRVTFLCADVGDYLCQAEPFSCVFLNPPREGCSKQVVESLGKLRPPRILYLSCDPATLARDLARLVPFGYQIMQVQPFDLFPQTAHVETLVHLKSSLHQP